MRRNPNIEEIEEEREQPLLKIKPKFNLPFLLVTKFVASLAVIIFIGTLLVQNNPEVFKIKYVILAVSIYVIYALIKLAIIRGRYNKTLYMFFQDRLVILKRYKRNGVEVIPYNQLEEIIFLQNYVEHLFDLGRFGIKIDGTLAILNMPVLEGIGDFSKTVEKLKITISI